MPPNSQTNALSDKKGQRVKQPKQCNNEKNEYIGIPGNNNTVSKKFRQKFVCSYYKLKKIVGQKSINWLS